MAKFILPFLISFVSTVVLIFLLKKTVGRFRWAERKSSRHIHSAKAYRLGGIAMIIAFNLSILASRDLFISHQVYGFMISTLIILVVGFWDDLRELFWKTQLFYQVAVAILIFIFGIRIYRITDPFGGVFNFNSSLGVIISMIMVVLWVVLMINSMNWLDGIDGLSGGISLIGALTIFFLSLYPEVNQPPVAILSLVLAGTILGFLIFNFYPSIVLAGTSGSMYMGFALAVLAIFAGTKIATAFLVMSLPIIDFAWVIGERIRHKKSVFRPDRNHLHHKLLELGWSQRKITLFFYAITALIAVVALNTRAIGKSVTMIAAVFIMAMSLIFINKKLERLKK